MDGPVSDCTHLRTCSVRRRAFSFRRPSIPIITNPNTQAPHAAKSPNHKIACIALPLKYYSECGVVGTAGFFVSSFTKPKILI